MGSTSYYTKEAGLNEVNELVHSVRRLLAKFHTSLPVQVLRCTNDGGVSPVGSVDLLVLVNQVDAAGNTVSPGATVYDVPYSRYQGGANAVILDPEVGDLGLACFCERDISIVMANHAAGNPGSNRRNSISDAIYVAAFPNATPTQYVRFSVSGIAAVSPVGVTATVGSGAGAPQIQVTTTSIVLSVGSGASLTMTSAGTVFVGPVSGNSTATFTGEGTFNGGHTVSQHEHQVTGVQTGSSTVTSQKPTG